MFILKTFLKKKRKKTGHEHIEHLLGPGNFNHMTDLYLYSHETQRMTPYFLIFKYNIWITNDTQKTSAVFSKCLVISYGQKQNWTMNRIYEIHYLTVQIKLYT